MYIINGVHRPEPGSSGGNISSNPQVSALIPRPAVILQQDKGADDMTIVQNTIQFDEIIVYPSTNMEYV